MLPNPAAGPPSAAPERPDSDHTVAPATGKPASRWGKRLGVAAFLFFLIKGLAWLVVPAAVAAFAVR